MILYESIPSWIIDIADHLKKKETCNDIMRINSEVVFLILYHLKTKEICNEGVEAEPSNLRYVPDHFKTQEMY